MNTLSIGRYTMASTVPAGPVGATGDSMSSDSLDGTDSTPAESSKWTAVTIEFSPAAQLYGKLQHLADTNPSKFKKVMGEMAAGLQDVARQSSPTDARAISNLSSEFAEAGQMGSALPLAPSSLPANFVSPYSAASGGAIPSIMAQSVSGPNSPGASGCGDDSQDLSQLGALFHDLMNQVGGGKAHHGGGNGYLA